MARPHLGLLIILMRLPLPCAAAELCPARSRQITVVPGCSASQSATGSAARLSGISTGRCVTMSISTVVWRWPPGNATSSGRAPPPCRPWGRAAHGLNAATPSAAPAVLTRWPAATPARPANAIPIATSILSSPVAHRPGRTVRPTTCSANIRTAHSVSSHGNRRTPRGIATQQPATRGVGQATVIPGVHPRRLTTTSRTPRLRSPRMRHDPNCRAG